MTVARFIQIETSPLRQAFADKHLGAVRRWVLLLSAALLLGSIGLGGPREQLGALCGTVLSLFNALVITELGRWASRGAAETARQRLGLLLLAFQLKLGLLAASIYLTLRYLPVTPLWLLLGLTVLPLGICALAIEYMLKRPRET